MVTKVKKNKEFDDKKIITSLFKLRSYPYCSCRNENWKNEENKLCEQLMSNLKQLIDNNYNFVSDKGISIITSVIMFYSTNAKCTISIDTLKYINYLLNSNFSFEEIVTNIFKSNYIFYYGVGQLNGKIGKSIDLYKVFANRANFEYDLEKIKYIHNCFYEQHIIPYGFYRYNKNTFNTSLFFLNIIESKLINKLNIDEDIIEFMFDNYKYVMLNLISNKKIKMTQKTMEQSCKYFCFDLVKLHIQNGFSFNKTCIYNISNFFPYCCFRYMNDYSLDPLHTNDNTNYDKDLLGIKMYKIIEFIMDYKITPTNEWFRNLLLDYHNIKNNNPKEKYGYNSNYEINDLNKIIDLFQVNGLGLSFDDILYSIRLQIEINSIENVNQVLDDDHKKILINTFGESYMIMSDKYMNYFKINNDDRNIISLRNICISNMTPAPKIKAIQKFISKYPHILPDIYCMRYLCRTGKSLDGIIRYLINLGCKLDQQCIQNLFKYDPECTNVINHMLEYGLEIDITCIINYLNNLSGRNPIIKLLLKSNVIQEIEEISKLKENNIKKDIEIESLKKQLEERNKEKIVKKKKYIIKKETIKQK